MGAARKIYHGPHKPVTGELIYPGFEPGSESNPANWPAWITGLSRAADLSNSLAQGAVLADFFANGFFADFVFQNPNFNYLTLNFTTDVTLDLASPRVMDFVQETRHAAKLILLRGRSTDAGLSCGAKS